MIFRRPQKERTMSWASRSCSRMVIGDAGTVKLRPSIWENTATKEVLLADQ